MREGPSLAAAAVFVAGLVAVAASASQERPETWRVLVLNTGDFYLPGGVRQEQALRSALVEHAPRRVEFRAEALDAVNFDLRDYEAEVLALLRRKHRDARFDLIMPMGTAALDFAERHRAELWPGVPLVFFSVGADLARGRRFGPGITGVTITFDLQGTLDLAIKLQPSARRVVVVTGAADYDRYWVSRVAEQIRRHAGLEATFLTGQPLDVMLGELRGIPSDSIVIYTSLSRDGTGQPFVPANVTEQIAQASHAPVYGFFETYLGRGIVAGSMSSFEAQGSRAAELALRVLNGEKAETIPVQPPPPWAAMVDWQQLQKRGLSEASLPAGARVLFRPRSLLEEYRWYIGGALLLLSVQAALIVALVVQNQKRRRAELETLRRRSELAHVGRVSTMGQLASALAHELNQPLGAILRNAEAAELFLKQSPPDLEELRSILADICKDDQRAGEVIDRMRALLKRRGLERITLDVATLVDEVMVLIRPDAVIRKVRLEIEIPGTLPDVLGDRVHLQQVLLNLILNGMDAMCDVPVEARRLVVRARQVDAATVEVAVGDAGPGVSAAKLARLFEPFFTTKPEGLGLGLPISSTIIGAHGGRIWAENGPVGATFYFTLPVSEG